MLRSDTPVAAQTYELATGTFEFTYTSGHMWLDKCEDGSNPSPDTIKFWIQTMTDSSGNTLYSPFSYFDSKDFSSNMDILELQTYDPNISAGVFTVAYAASYYHSVSFDEAFYSGTFTLTIAETSSCNKHGFTVPTGTTYDYGVNPGAPIPADFHLALPYGNHGCHFDLTIKNGGTEPWLASFTDQVLTQVQANGNYHWQTSTAAFFTLSSNDLLLVGLQAEIEMRMAYSYESGLSQPKEHFKVHFNFKELCVPNLQLTPFAAESVLIGETRTIEFTHGSNGNCWFAWRITNQDDSPIDSTIFSHTSAANQKQADSIDIYQMVTNKFFTINSSDPTKRGLYTLKIKVVN